MSFKSGFVAIVGAPNVGKSSLLNAIIGEKVAITTDKPQTTRGKINGIYNSDEAQIVFIDTPGLHRSRTKLGEYMNKSATSALEGVDAVIFMFDERFKASDLEGVREILGQVTKPVLAVVNKTDLIPLNSFAPIVQKLQDSALFNTVLGVSAFKKAGIDLLIKDLTALMPEGPRYYDEELYTDMNLREMVCEIIREKVLLYMEDEIPHGVAVLVEEFKTRKDRAITDISCVIAVEKDSHKGMVIGKCGRKLKGIAMAGRKDIERLLDGKVNLRLFVKVKSDWREKVSDLKEFGYDIKNL